MVVVHLTDAATSEQIDRRGRSSPITILPD